MGSTQPNKKQNVTIKPKALETANKRLPTVRIYKSGINFEKDYDFKNQLFWASKKDGEYLGMYDFGSCKDWLHEAISDYIHETSFGGRKLLQTKKDITINFDTDPFLLGMVLADGSFKNLKGFIKHLNYYESKLGLIKTTMKPCKIERVFKETQVENTLVDNALLFSFDPKYFKALPLIHLFILIARNNGAFKNGTNITTLMKDVGKSFSKTLDKDDILWTLIEYNYIRIILNNFDTIFKDIPIEKIHPYKPNHNGFGINALRHGRYYNKTVVKRFKACKDKLYKRK